MSAFGGRRTGIGEDSNDVEESPLKTIVDSAIRVTDKRGQRDQSEYHDRVAETIARVDVAEPEKTLDELITECFMNPGPGRVVVKPDIFKYKGKLTVPDESKRSGTTATVLAVGYGCNSMFWDKHLDDGKGNIGGFRTLQPGDKVAYGTWTGTQFRFDQRPSYRILGDDEIATLLDKDATKLLDVEA